MCDALGEREFDIEQANRLLAMRKNGGWRLPEDSKFEYKEGYGIDYRRNTEKNKRTRESEDNQ